MSKEKPKRIYKGRQVNVRLTDGEYGELETKAKAAGLTVPYVVKKAVLGKRIPQRKPPKVSDEIAHEIAKQLRGIGVNMNQIARQLNINLKHGREQGYHETELAHYMDNVSRELENVWRTLS